MKGVITVVVVLLAVMQLSAQRAGTTSNEVKKYLYTFTGASDQQQLDKLQSGTYQLKGVTEVKVTYKWDSGAGQMFFSHTSSKKIGEQAEEFNPSDVKRIISDLGLVPFEFREL